MNENQLWEALDPLQSSRLHISDYIQEISRILFMKAVSESNRITFEKNLPGDVHLEEEYRWESIVEEDDAQEMLNKYKKAIEKLGKNGGKLGEELFGNYETKFEKPTTFKRLVSNLDSLETSKDMDDFGDAYEYLLEKYADKAEGAGEYFTPRPVIKAMVEFSEPEVKKKVMDPAAGTNGFIIETYNYLKEKTDRFENIKFNDKNPTAESYFTTQEVETSTYNLGGLNLLLHGMNPSNVNRDNCDSINKYIQDGYEETYDFVIANPPYGTSLEDTEILDPKCSSTIESNFLFMIMNLLSENGKASVVIPEGILFNNSYSSLREELLNYYDIDCILCLPEGAFSPYAGITANVIFFERDEDGTDEFWYYDARTDFDKVGKKENPLRYNKHLRDFVENRNNREDSEKYFKVGYDEVDKDGYELHLKKYKEFKYEGHRAPSKIADDIRDELDKIKTELDRLEGDKND